MNNFLSFFLKKEQRKPSYQSLTVQENSKRRLYKPHEMKKKKKKSLLSLKGPYCIILVCDSSLSLSLSLSLFLWSIKEVHFRK